MFRPKSELPQPPKMPTGPEIMEDVKKVPERDPIFDVSAYKDPEILETAQAIIDSIHRLTEIDILLKKQKTELEEGLRTLHEMTDAMVKVAADSA